MRKKILSAVLVSTMAISLFAGCGKKTEPAPEPAVEEASVEEPAPEQAPAQSTEEASVIEEARPTSLDDALGLAVLEYNDEYFDQGEVAGEGHILLDKEGDDKGEQVCYILSTYGRYEFQDGNFVCCAGNGVIPCVVKLELNEEGEYNFVSLEPAADGPDFVDWIKENIPEAYWSRCITIEDEDRSELDKQQNSYAEEYLATIGREDAEIGDYGDYEHQILTDVGVKEDVSNAMLDVQSGKTFENKCPYWLGEREVIEKDVRYIYKTEYDKKKGQIKFSKTEYDTGDAVEESVYDAKTGEKVE